MTKEKIIHLSVRNVRSQLTEKPRSHFVEIGQSIELEQVNSTPREGLQQWHVRGILLILFPRGALYGIG